MDTPILISFSGGRSSAFMAKLLMEHEALQSTPKVACFANTGKEYEATLRFVNECDKRWNLGLVWLEAVINPAKGKGTEWKQVNYETAARSGEPFEAVIQKYGLPNRNYPHCTRELKQVPIRKYMQSLNYTAWRTAVGIRADEKHRLKRNTDSNFLNPYYPLAGDLIDVDEPFIRAWWEKQPFDLQLKDYQSNCDLCWKKSKRKRLTILSESPERAAWWQQMELQYGKGRYQFDQREGLSIDQLIKLAKAPFHKAVDKLELKHQAPHIFDYNMDMETACFCKS